MQNKNELAAANAEDLTAVAEIEMLSSLNHWGIENYRAALTSDENLFYLFKIENKVVGFVFARLIMPELEIYNIAVLPEYRKQGIGRKLFERIIEKAVKIGCEICWLEVQESNQTARRFYEKLGFRCVGRRKNYYQSPVEDALLLEFNISKEPCLKKRFEL